MKHLLFGLAAIITFYSCNNGNNRSRIQNDTEAQKIKAIEQSRIDSLELVRVDSLASIAWGDTNFGMSFNEARKTETFKKAFVSGNKADSYRKLCLFGDEFNIYGMSSTEANFFEDSLVSIKMESNEKNANYYDTDIKETVLRLKKQIEYKYGKPTENYGFPAFFEMKPDKGIRAYGWSIGCKYIYIDVKEVYSGSQYKIECAIFQDKETVKERELRIKAKEEIETKSGNGF